MKKIYISYSEQRCAAFKYHLTELGIKYRTLKSCKEIRVSDKDFNLLRLLDEYKFEYNDHWHMYFVVELGLDFYFNTFKIQA